MKKPRYITKIDIRGSICKIFIHPSSNWDQFAKSENAENSDAFFDTELNEIHLNEDKITFEILVHEINHAFINSCYPERLQLTVLQMEELACEIMAYHGKRILELSTLVLSKLKVPNKAKEKK